MAVKLQKQYRKVPHTFSLFPPKIISYMPIACSQNHEVDFGIIHRPYSDLAMPSRVCLCVCEISVITGGVDCVRQPQLRYRMAHHHKNFPPAFPAQLTTTPSPPQPSLNLICTTSNLFSISITLCKWNLAICDLLIVACFTRLRAVQTVNC